MISFDFEQKCYGCSLCAQVCPKNAIQMVPDFEGFLMPKVDDDKCVKCGLCVKKCPRLTVKKSTTPLTQSICKAAFRRDDSRKNSASGGAAAVISEEFIKKGNVVIGCAWDENLIARHIAVDNGKDLTRLQSSKYVQSDMQEAYEGISTSLKNEKKCLFIGTPCQTAAVRNMFGNPDGLYLIGLICGGVPSPKVWAKFKDGAEQKYGSKMVYANFRCKGRYGWNTPVALYKFENGKKSEKLSFQLDDYVLQYLFGVFKRNSCYQCEYKGDNINADLILGDFWGNAAFRDRSDNKGVSAVVLLTEKGVECAKLLESSCEIIDTTIEDILYKNQPLIVSVGRGGNRAEFFKELDKSSYSSAAKKFGGRYSPVKYYGMLVLDKTGLFEKIKRFIKG